MDKSQRKSINGVRENPNGGGLQQLPLLRERVSPVCKAFVCYSQVPNKQGGQNKWGGGKFQKVLINGGGGNFAKSLINIYSTFRVQKHANNRQ